MYYYIQRNIIMCCHVLLYQAIYHNNYTPVHSHVLPLWSLYCLAPYLDIVLVTGMLLGKRHFLLKFDQPTRSTG